jgi:hypothetical protein
VCDTYGAITTARFVWRDSHGAIRIRACLQACRSQRKTDAPLGAATPGAKSHKATQMPPSVTTIGEEEKAQVRAVVFGHLAGMVVAPTVKALWDRRVFESLRFRRRVGRVRPFIAKKPVPIAVTCESHCACWHRAAG